MRVPTQHRQVYKLFQDLWNKFFAESWKSYLKSYVTLKYKSTKFKGKDFSEKGLGASLENKI